MTGAVIKMLDSSQLDCGFGIISAQMTGGCIEPLRG